MEAKKENDKVIKTIITDRLIGQTLLVFAGWVIFLGIPITLYFIFYFFNLLFLILIEILLLLPGILCCSFTLKKRIISLSKDGIEYQVGNKKIFSMAWISFNELELHRYKTILPAGDTSVKTTITKIKFTGNSGVQDYKINLRKIKLKEFLKELIRFAEIMNKKLIVKKSFEDISRNQAILEEFI